MLGFDVESLKVIVWFTKDIIRWILKRSSFGLLMCLGLIVLPAFCINIKTQLLPMKIKWLVHVSYLYSIVFSCAIHYSIQLYLCVNHPFLTNRLFSESLNRTAEAREKSQTLGP